MGSVVHNGSQQQTDGDGPLVSTDNGSTNPLGSGLGLVQRNCDRSVLEGIFQHSFRELLTECGDQADSKAGKESTGEEDGNVSRNGLQDDTEIEDPGRGGKTHATSDGIGEERRSQSTKEGTGRKDRDDCRLLGGRDIGVPGGVHITGAE